MAVLDHTKKPVNSGHSQISTAASFAGQAVNAPIHARFVYLQCAEAFRVGLGVADGVTLDDSNSFYYAANSGSRPEPVWLEGCAPGGEDLSDNGAPKFTVGTSGGGSVGARYQS